MQLDLMTWPELGDRLSQGACVMLPTGSTEQHGPMGLVGTDTICANRIALAAAELCGGIVAPPLAYTPAPFNTSFPGTVSITSELMHMRYFLISEQLYMYSTQSDIVLSCRWLVM